MKIKTKTLELTGTHYEIGMELGKMATSIPILKKCHTNGFYGFGEKEVKKAEKLFLKWCPGLVEELHGFADTLQVPVTQIFFYGMTYLKPNCSQIALLPAMTKDSRPLVARNYEFSHEAEDFILMRTNIPGKYTHLGTSVLLFGRDDGFNECGLAVTMSSCGFPVGAVEYMRKPKVIGLQFWAVVRTILENCQDVKSALDFVKEMPIAYNLNMIFTDKSGRIALFETLDGKKVSKEISQEESELYLFATNHPVLPELIAKEPKAMRHSIERYQWIEKILKGRKNITKEDLKKMLLSKYPNGLCCHYFKDFFGTTKSMIIDPSYGTIDLCWGGRIENGWNRYPIQKPLKNEEKEIEIIMESFCPEMGEYLSLEIE